MIEISLFGPTRVTVDGERRSAADLGGTRPKQILEMLAMDLGNPVPKDRLAERLWDGAPPATYAAILESYVCVLRRGLGAGRGRGSALTTTHRAYLLDPARVQVDVVDVRRRLALVGQGSRRSSVEHAERALTAAGRELLADDAYAAWAVREREAFAQLLVAGCTDAALLANDLGESTRAVRLARAATRQGILVETAWQALMLALWHGGQGAEALQAYADLRAATLEELGAEPGQASEDLYLSILRDRATRQPDIGPAKHEITTLIRLLRQALEIDASSTAVLDGEPRVVEHLRAVLAAPA